MDYKFINTGYLDAVAGEDNIYCQRSLEFSRTDTADATGNERTVCREDYYSLGLLAHKAKSSIAIMGMDDLLHC